MVEKRKKRKKRSRRSGRGVGVTYGISAYGYGPTGWTSQSALSGQQFGSGDSGSGGDTGGAGGGE